MLPAVPLFLNPALLSS